MAYQEGSLSLNPKIVAQIDTYFVQVQGKKAQVYKYTREFFNAVIGQSKC